MQYIKYVPLSLFAGLVLKGLVHGFTPVDAAVCGVLGIIAAVYEYKAQDKKMLELLKSVEAHQKEVERLKTDLDAVKTHVASIKMATGFRTAAKIG